MNKRPLNEREKAFIDAIFSNEAQGNATKAKILAGYAETYPTRYLVERLQDEILEETRKYLAQVAPKAAFSIYDVLTNPSDIGTKEKLNAAKNLLDRVGIVKTEKIEINNGGVIILPPKDAVSDEDDE